MGTEIGDQHALGAGEHRTVTDALEGGIGRGFGHGPALIPRESDGRAPGVGGELEMGGEPHRGDVRVERIAGGHGRARQVGVQVLLFQAFAPIGVVFGGAETGGRLGDVVLIDVAEGDDILPRDGAEVGGCPSAGADQGDVELAVGRVFPETMPEGRINSPAPATVCLRNWRRWNGLGAFMRMWLRRLAADNFKWFLRAWENLLQKSSSPAELW